MRKMIFVSLVLLASTVSTFAKADESASAPPIPSQLIQIRTLDNSGNVDPSDSSGMVEQPLATCVAHRGGKYFIRRHADPKVANERSLNACSGGNPSKEADCTVVCY